MILSKTHKLRRQTFLFLAITTVFAAGVVCLIGYYFCVVYSVPFRLQGRYEANTYYLGRPFAIAPDGKQIVFASIRSGHGDLYTCASDGSHLRRLTNDPNYEGNPAYSPDGKQIAFTREDHKCGHIWVMNSDGSDARQLTFGSDYDSDPIYVPDGQQIWFSRTPQGTAAGYYTVYRMTRDGRDIAPIDAHDRAVGRQTAFSPWDDGVYYAVIGSGESEIWWMRRDGALKRHIGAGSWPCVSPDGKQFCFIGFPDNHTIWCSAAGSNPVLVCRTQNEKTFVRFCPDGRHLLYLEYASNADRSYIVRVNLDGSGLQRVVQVN
jgi:Tol biopolymer transport system component